VSVALLLDVDFGQLLLAAAEKADPAEARLGRREARVVQSEDVRDGIVLADEPPHLTHLAFDPCMTN